MRKHENASRFAKTNRNHPIPSRSWPITPYVHIRLQSVVMWAHRGQMRSNEVTIRFSPINRDRMEKETRKWCQTIWPVEPLRMLCILTYMVTIWPWPDPTWVKFSDWPIKVKKYMFRTGSTRRARWLSFLFSYLISKKLLMLEAIWIAARGVTYPGYISKANAQNKRTDGQN